MKMWLSHIIQQIDPIQHYLHHDELIERIYTDSRKIFHPQHALFIAIKGIHHDGHKFIPEAIEKGIQHFIVENEEYFPTPHTCNVIVVKNTLLALQQIARCHRTQFKGRTVAITGSNGKTITKEWLFHIFSSVCKTYRSPKSYNSQIGVPLSLLMADPHADLYFIEAGISLPDEMKRLSDLILPDEVIFTHLGDAHLTNFNDKMHLLQEKSLLFTHARTIFSSYHEYLPNLKHELPGKKFLYWSAQHPDAPLFLINTIKQESFTEIQVRWQQKEEYTFTIPFHDPFSIHNIMNCLLYALFHHIPIPLLQSKLAGLPAISMRMETRKGKNNCTLICDFYNADPGSLLTSFEYLAGLKHQQDPMLILSDFDGFNDPKIYQYCIQEIIRYRFSAACLLGPQWPKDLIHSLSWISHFENKSELIEYLKKNPPSHKIILIKGSRKYRLEEIAELLEPLQHSAILEINLNHIRHNYHYFRRLLPSSTKIMIMIKAFGYGTGLEELASYLSFLGCDYFAVAFTDEGIALRKAGVKQPILVLNPESQTFASLIDYSLTPEIYSLEQYLHFRQQVLMTSEKIPYPIHLKIDTGMHRLGFLPQDLPTLCEMLRNENVLTIEGIMTHLAASENNLHDAFTHTQINTFQHAYQQLSECLGYQPMRHVLNSAGIVRFPQYAFEMVRLGIGLHGFIGDKIHPPLIQPQRLITKISQIKTIAPQESVGYGRHFVAQQPTRIAIIPIGYADGLRRSLGQGKWSLLIKGKKAPIVGNICMDMTMVDVSHIDCVVGDEVIITDAHHSIDKMSRICQTIPYEILTGFSQRIKRIFHEE